MLSQLVLVAVFSTHLLVVEPRRRPLRSGMRKAGDDPRRASSPGNPAVVPVTHVVEIGYPFERHHIYIAVGAAVYPLLVEFNSQTHQERAS